MTLVGYWPMNELSGGTSYDHSGSELHGDIDGAFLGVDGILGQPATEFDGVDDIVTIDASLVDMGWDDHGSMFCWINHNGSSSSQDVLSDWDSDGSTLRINSSNELRAYAYGGGQIHDDRPTYAGIDPGVWWHLGVFLDGEDIGISVNGKIVDREPITGQLGQTNSTFRIGDRGDATSNKVDGTVAEVRVFSRALTGSEIQYLYEVGSHATLTTEVKTGGN